MQSATHKQHIASRIAHSNCPECNADTSRRHAITRPFRYAYVSEYLGYVRPRLNAIANGENGAAARTWHADFVRALHSRISSHVAGNGRKWAHEYAKYHLATYGNDARFLSGR